MAQQALDNVLFGNSASLDQAGAIDEEIVGALIVFVRRNDVESLLEAQLHVVGQQNRIPCAVSETLGTQHNEVRQSPLRRSLQLCISARYRCRAQRSTTSP